MDKFKNLSDLFDNCFEKFNQLNKSDKPTNCSEIQATIKLLITNFEEATKLVSLVDMFSNNESFDDVSTENIKFFLLPALLGMLTIKICDIENRMNIIDVAEIYFSDFLKRIKLYKIIDILIPEVIFNENDEINKSMEKSESDIEAITKLVIIRNTKIKQFQEKKELESKLDILQKNLENPNIDDESRRDYYVTLIKIFANEAVDELHSLASEKRLLKCMKSKKKSNLNEKFEDKTSKVTLTRLQPIIITRNEMQKKVFGAGYPSLPVLTVEEFYDKKVENGEWQKHSIENQISNKKLQGVTSNQIDENFEKDEEDGKEEKKIEEDDLETLTKARMMDDFKDTNRRGYGNRHNRS